MNAQRGSILVGMLWCMVLLAVVVVGVLHTSRMDLLVVKNYNDRLQAHYLALAGLERAKALLYHDYITRRQTSKNHTGVLYDDSGNFQDVQFGRGHIRIMRRASSDDGGGLVYGISDEESRLNINMASAEALTNLNGMTTDLAASILAWRTAPSQGAKGGAESDYYSSLKPPYVPRNGPFQTVRELLMVRGVTPELLLGGANHNRYRDGADNGDFRDESGWSTLMTVNSTGKDFSADGKQRVNVKSANERDLEAIQGMKPNIARAIVSWRGQNQFQSIGDLLSVTEATNTGRRRFGGDNTSPQPLIDDQLFAQIADNVTIGDGTDLVGLINVNTASLDVLTCLPGIDRVMAQSIITYRRSAGYFDNIGGLLKVPGMTHDIFKQIAGQVTARSETFRITSEGKITSTGAGQRMQAIVHIGAHEAATLAYREDL